MFTEGLRRTFVLINMIKGAYPNFNPQLLRFYPDCCMFTIDERLRVYVNPNRISYMAFPSLQVLAQTKEPLFTQEVVKVLDDLLGKV